MASPLRPGSLVFKVKRSKPELVAPAKPTPRELKPLSDIDDQEGLRFHIPVIQIYKCNPSMQGKDPVRVIREAVAEALVFYYPFAGRLRELPGRKLAVDCTAEGVLFIGADADVSLDEFGTALQPPFPCFDQLLFDVPGSEELLHSPLLLIQVTRLKCGGFIFAIRFNHTMCDGGGICQLMTAIGELARGATAPSVAPVWRRDLLSARTPPRVTFAHREYSQVPEANTNKGNTTNNMTERSFFFGQSELSAIRALLPRPAQLSSSAFELLTAFLWRRRAVALRGPPDEEARMLCMVNVRAKLDPPLPPGYYGNAIAFAAAASSTARLCVSPLGYAVGLVREAKAAVTEEYVRSVADLMATKGRPCVALERSYLVSDLSHIALREVDFGWGKAVYGGPAKGSVGPMPGGASFYIACRSRRGEEGIVVPVCLPALAMERFAKELDCVFKERVGETSVVGDNMSKL